MSTGNNEAQQRKACPGAAGVYFFNSLMSDVESDWSLIHDAALNGRLVSLQRLIAQVNGTTVDGHTALTGACARGRVAYVHLLLEHIANPRGNRFSSSPIHWAAAKGADVNRSGSGDSPLHIAARLSSLELVSVLLDHGAEGLRVNSEGKLPLDTDPPSSRVGRLLRGAEGVSSPKKLCRLHIRKTVGKQRLGGIPDLLRGIPDLHLPTKLIQYLLYQSGHRDAQKH